MPTISGILIVGILPFSVQDKYNTRDFYSMIKFIFHHFTYMSKWNFMLSLVEHENKFYNFGAWPGGYITFLCSTDQSMKFVLPMVWMGVVNICDLVHDRET